VEAWQLQLSPLDDQTPTVAPPVAVWQQIAAEIAPVKPVVAAPAKPGLWHSLALWRGLAFAGTAAAAIAVAQIGGPPPAPGAPPQMLVAALADADGKPLLSAAYDPLRGAVVLTPATQRDDAGKSPELWVIEGDKPPRSLGVIDIHGPNAHAISSKRLAGLAPGSVLAISIEPLGGSPTGQPTGPVVATGKLTPV
jgi:anti-sigma-K factor RskA